MRTIFALIASLAVIAPAVAVAGDPYAEVDAMRAAFAQVHSAVAQERFNTGDVATVEFSAPDNYHITTANSQIILTGDVEYAKRTGGHWMKSSLGAQHQVLLTAVWQLAGPPNVDIHKLFKVTALGTKSLNGTTLRGYQLHDTDGAYDETVWIGPNNLPVTAKIDMTDTSVEIHYANYNTSLLIATPQ